MANSGVTSYAMYQGMVIGEYAINLIEDIENAKRVIESSLDEFIADSGVTDFSWDGVMLEMRDHASGLYETYEMTTGLYVVENLTYGQWFQGYTLKDAYALYEEWNATLIGMYRGFVITRTEDGYMADCEGLMSRFECADILDMRDAIDSEHDSQNRAWASDYGGESRESFTDSENFIRDVMAGKY